MLKTREEENTLRNSQSHDGILPHLSLLPFLSVRYLPPSAIGVRVLSSAIAFFLSSRSTLVFFSRAHPKSRDSRVKLRRRTEGKRRGRSPHSSARHLPKEGERKRKRREEASSRKEVVVMRIGLDWALGRKCTYTQMSDRHRGTCMHLSLW